MSTSPSMPASPTTSSPLTPEQLQELAKAQKQWRKIRSAMAVAGFSGWTVCLFAALSLLGAMFSWTGLIIGLVLGASGVTELMARERLGRLQADAARTLAINQLVLAGIICLYAVWAAHSALAGNSDIANALKEATSGYDVDVQQSYPGLLREMVLTLYGGLAVGTVIAQGSLAWYYLRRGRVVRSFAATTPPWIIQLLRDGFRMPPVR